MTLAMMKALLLLLVSLLLANPSSAHEMSMAEMSLRETSPGEFAWQWTATSDRVADGGRSRFGLARDPAAFGHRTGPPGHAVRHRRPGRLLDVWPRRRRAGLTMDEIIGLFPTPFMRVPGALNATLVRGLVEHFSGLALTDNNASAQLTHTRLLRPVDSPLLVDVARLISPKLIDFGALLFGERLGWSVKEMGVNLLEAGGRQAMHNHANSFVSGVLYLTPTHPDAQTVFMKSPGGTDFAFKNEHAGMTPGPFSADKWVSPTPQPGDLVLFPSYLMHAVPPNPGERRITMAFNAIPTRLDSWGYTVTFAG